MSLQHVSSRLIVDEGHVAGGGERSSNAMALARMMNVERRWAITGSEFSYNQVSMPMLAELV